MSLRPFRFCFTLLSACLVLGCGGGGSETPTGTATETDPATGAPTAPSTVSTAGGSTASRGPRIDTSTPDGTVKEAIQAVQDNEFERVWDLLPKSMQDNVNDVFKEFGKQVDAELWDKSFNLLNRYVSVLVAKEEMVYQTPEAQAQFEQMKTMLTQFGIGGDNSELLTQEKLRELGEPMNQFVLTLLKSEFSSTKKLKTYDGRVFCAKTLNPMVGHLRTFFGNLMEEASQVEQLQSSPQFQMMGQMDFQKMFDGIKVRTESQDGDFAVVVIEYPAMRVEATGTPGGGTTTSSVGMEPREERMNFVRVDGKWVPEQLGLALPQQLAMAKSMIPMLAGQINAQKPRVMPALAQIEPLVDDLQKAKTQEEFNVAYANFNSQAPQLMASAMGMPGLSAMMGGGKVQISPVTIELQGEVTDEQLGETIKQLEALTDAPEQAITLPKRDVGQVVLEITPVGDPQAFAGSINFARRAEYDPSREIILLELEPPPAKPAEESTSADSEPE